MKYNSNLESLEMSYFRLNLLSYLRDSHPELMNNLSFIAGRGDMAAEAYSEAVKSGLDHVQAAEIANDTLFKGLRFSPYNLVIEILWNEFFDEVSPGEAREKARELMPECWAVFAKYTLNDDFTGTAEFRSLYTELVGTIVIQLENELQ